MPANYSSGEMDGSTMSGPWSGRAQVGLKYKSDPLWEVVAKRINFPSVEKWSDSDKIDLKHQLSRFCSDSDCTWVIAPSDSSATVTITFYFLDLDVFNNVCYDKITMDTGKVYGKIHLLLWSLPLEIYIRLHMKRKSIINYCTKTRTSIEYYKNTKWENNYIVCTCRRDVE